MNRADKYQPAAGVGDCHQPERGDRFQRHLHLKIMYKLRRPLKLSELYLL